MTIRPQLKVEMVFIQKSYPDIESIANSYIGEYLKEIDREDLIRAFDLLPFPIRVQALERTLVDKVFAICDYYLRKETTRNSRHIYDISQILTRVELTDELKPLIASVRSDRKPNKTCVSAQDGVKIPKLLQEILDTEYFKKDYLDSTDKLLMKPVPYEEAIKGLEKVRKSELFLFDD